MKPLIPVLALLFILSECFFIVQPTEMAGVRRLGTVLSKEPCPPGFHFNQGIRVRGDALKENERVIELTLAQRWSGQPPQTILGERGAVPFFNIGGNAINHSQPAPAPR